MWNRKLSYILFLVVLLVIIVVFYIRNTANPDPKILCENTNGSWVERGTDAECETLNENECAMNQNCMAVMKPVGRNLPAFVFGECKHFASCKCPEGGAFYFKSGCGNGLPK